MKEKMRMAFDQPGRKCVVRQIDHLRIGRWVYLCGRPGFLNSIPFNQEHPSRMQLFAIKHCLRTEENGVYWNGIGSLEWRSGKGNRRQGEQEAELHEPA